MVLRGLHPVRSIRAKLFFLHVFILVPFVGLGLLWTKDAAMGERSRMVALLDDRASEVAALTSAIVEEETAVLRTIAELPPIEEGRPTEMNAVLSAMLPHHPIENNFHVIDASGMIIASGISRDGEGKYLGESELFRAVMRTGQPFSERARIAQEGRSAGHPVDPIGVPLRNHAGRQIGVLVGEVILSEVQRLVSLGPDANGGYVYVVDRAGEIIAHPNIEHARALRDFSQVPPVHELLEGKEGTLEYIDPIQNVRFLATYKKIPETGWGVVSVYPSAVISGTMVRTGLNVLIVFGISLTVALVAAYVAGNKMADRITRLASTARAVGAEEMERQVELVSEDEIGIIGRALNAISSRLREQVASLENVSQALKGSCEDVGTALASGLDVEEAVRLAMVSSARLASVEAAIGLIAEDEKNLRVVKSIGPVPPQVIGQLLPLDGRPSILGRAVREHQPQQVQDVQASEVPLDPIVALGRRAGFPAALVVPMVSYGRCLGALVLFDVRTPRVFPEEEVSRIQMIAGEAATAIATSRLQQQIRGANEQLMLAGLRLRTIIETIPEGVVVAEAPSGRITMSNSEAEQLLGREITSQVDLHEQSRAYRLFHADGKPYKDEELPLYRSVTLGETDTKEIVVRRPKNGDITLLFSSAPLKDGEGRVVGGVGVFRDISKVKELDRLKDEFISVTSHELKSPLTVVKGYAQLLLRRIQGMPGREEETKWLRTVADQSSRLATLVDRLLDVSRIQTGTLELVRAPMDIVALAQEVAEHEQVTTALHQIRVYAEAPELVGNWDKTRLEQVLINLVDNAIKYSPQGGPIDIAIRRINDEAQVSVEDHGLGIARDDLRRIFEKFYRAHEGKGRPSGLGLGLYISYQIVNLHGGRMWVESELGKGSIFYFALPLNRNQSSSS